MALPRPAMTAPARVFRSHMASSTARLTRPTRPTMTVPMPIPMLMPTPRRPIVSCHQCRLLRQHSRPGLSALVPALAGRPSLASGSFSPSTVSPFSAASSSSSAPQSQAQPSTAAPASPHREPVPLTDSQYHDLADDYLDRLLVRLEEMQDAREDVDVEFSAGVLTLSFTGAGSGGADRTYVLNKQPPNKQIWLSSPVSGPKRYDWVLMTAGEGDGGEADGEWIYLKDGSSLDSLVKEEIGVNLRESGPDDSL